MPDGMKVICNSTNRIICKSSMCEYCVPNIYGSLGGPSECECHARELIYQLFYHTIVWTNESAPTIADAEFYIQTWDFSGYEKTVADNWLNEIVETEGETTNPPELTSFTINNSPESQKNSAFVKYISLEFERLDWDYSAPISYETYIYKLKDCIRNSIVADTRHDSKLDGPQKERICHGTTRFKNR